MILWLTRLRKTSIAKEYAHIWNQSNKGSVIWINADTDETITHDISAILREALPPDVYSQLDDDDRRIRRFLNLLREQENWLLIFDNADNIELKFDLYLPLNGKGHALFTSRNSRLSALLPSAVDIKVGRLPDDEALDMFLAIANRRDIAEEYVDKQHVPTRLIKDLDNFPLAIAQAASFLRYHNSISCTTYVQSLKDEDERLTLLSFSTKYENYSKTVSTTWEVSYQNLLRTSETIKAASLLCILGFLGSAGVSESDLHSVHGTHGGRLRKELLEHTDVLRDNLDFKRSVDTLIALSLVQKTPNFDIYFMETRHNFLTVHPLVHEWIRIRLRYQPDGTRLTANMVKLSNAILLQMTPSMDLWQVQKQTNYYVHENAAPSLMIQRTRETLLGNPPMVKVQNFSIETVLWICLNFVCLPRPILNKELLPIASSIPISGLNEYSSAHENHSFPETSMLAFILFEGLDSGWFSSREYLSNITKMGTSAIESEFRPYIECLIDGIQCMHALAAMIATGKLEVGPSSAKIDLSYSHRADSKFWQKRLCSDLGTFAAGDKISQLFVSWNLSHNALPEAVEANWEFAWYRHFCRCHNYLLTTVNGLLWPQYLRIQLYPLTESDVPYHDRDLYHALHHPMVAKAWEWQATSVCAPNQRAISFSVAQTKFTRYYKAGRFTDAERFLVDYLGSHECLKLQNKGLFGMIIVIVAESMQRRG